jgi:outer membrane protein TolC
MKNPTLFSKTLAVTLAASLMTVSAQAQYSSKHPGGSTTTTPPSSPTTSPSKAEGGADVAHNPQPPMGPSVVNVDPEYLRQRVLSSNLNIEVELNTVKDQKTIVNKDRAALLPSLNLSVGALGNPGGFLLNAVEFMFPFLIPSNWFQLNAQENVFQAEKVSYKVLELNTYAQALSMYYAILADNQSAQIYQQQADDLMNIYNEKQKANDALGQITPPEDLLTSLSNAQIAKSTALNALELTYQEIAALRQVLSLPETTKINLKNYSEPTLAVETQSINDVAQQALNAAPEYQQIMYLAKAGEAGVWNASFSWITGASATATIPGGAAGASSGRIPDFAGMSGELTFHLGADIFPTIELSQRNVTEIRLRLTALQQQVTQSVEAAMASVNEAVQEYQLAQQGEANQLQAYNIYRDKYDLGGAGGVTIIDVLTAHSELTTASITKIRALQDLNDQRVTLERALISQQFAKIKGCVMSRQTGGFLGGIFGGTNAKIDQVCREGGNNLAAAK